LDEATSALDHENEQKIQQALLRLQGKLTIVIIAHRETTIAHADKCVALGKGRSDSQTTNSLRETPMIKNAPDD
jgi:ATP-binding cassette subfamily C protein